MTRKPELYIGKPVRSLQTMLRSLSEQNERILPVIPDGRYGRNTFASVSSFQEQAAIPVTGTADPTTWAAIADAYDTAFPAAGSGTLMLIRPSDFSLSPGDQHPHAYLVQAMFEALASFFPDLQAPEHRGTLDAATVHNLKLIQQAADLEPTGQLNRITWRYLHDLYRTMTITKNTKT